MAKKKFSRIEMRHVLYSIVAYMALFMMVSPLKTIMTRLLGDNMVLQLAVGTVLLLIIGYLTELDKYL